MRVCEVPLGGRDFGYSTLHLDIRSHSVIEFGGWAYNYGAQLTL